MSFISAGSKKNYASLTVQKMCKSPTMLKNSEEDLILNMVTVEQNPVSAIVFDLQSSFVTKNVIV